MIESRSPIAKTKPETAVQFVERNYPLGAKLTHRIHGGLYEMGNKESGGFWLMQLEPNVCKGKLSAECIRQDFTAKR